MATPTTQSSATLTSATATSSQSCVSVVPDKYGHVPFYACNANYTFNPSHTANLVFALLFAATTLIHAIQGIFFKKFYCWVVVMGGLWEFAAFFLKTLGSHDQQNDQYALWGQLLFLLAPLWVNAFAYMTVARMMYMALPEKKLWGIPSIKLTVIFVWLDIVFFLIQGAGGAMLSSQGGENTTRIGMKLYEAGIGVQMGFIVVFIVMTVWFYRRAHQAANGRLGRMQWLIYVMLAVLSLIIMRIAYRLAEFGPGYNSKNKLITHESYPLGLDAAPMFLAFFLLNVLHPGLVLRGPDGDFPKRSRAEKKAIKQQKKSDKLQAKEEKRKFKENKKFNKQFKGKKDSAFVYMGQMETAQPPANVYYQPEQQRPPPPPPRPASQW